MTLLIISPDYASHLLPLATLGTGWLDNGHRVVVASGPATAPIVESFGFERVDLRLGKGSNPGIIRAEEQPAGEDDALRGFFDATRHGMVATLEFQASARLSDLMWQPVETARSVQAIVADVTPDTIIVDHLAFSARLGLVAGRVPHADVVVGHPSALPVGDEVYGFPTAWPRGFEPDEAGLARLLGLCREVDASFTAEWNSALLELDPSATPSTGAFAEHGETVLFNYPRELADSGRSPTQGTHLFLGASVRSEEPDAEVDAWLDASDEPYVYVSFGSFLSVRSDVLTRVASAIEGLGMRAAFATGSSDRALLGKLPASWIVRGFLPQVTLLRSAAVAVTHGGNNSVTEAMSFGVPLVVMPFSTDQFAGAAAIEEHGFGEALDPNSATADEIRDSLARVLSLPVSSRNELNALALSLRQDPGSARAFAKLARPRPTS